jgi:hypothetical protein
MTADPNRRYAIIPLPAGPAPADALVVGGMDDVMENLPQTAARHRRLRQLDEAEKRHLGQIEAVNARVDSVLERERQVEEREQALREDAIRRLADGMLRLGRRLDAFEQAQARAALDALPDPDHPQGLSRAQQDDWLPPSTLEAPHPTDKAQLEATIARDREADDAAESVGDLPPELDTPPQSGNFVAPEDPAGTGTRSVATGPQADARRRRSREPKPRKGRDWPAQPIAVSLMSEE